MVEAPCPRYEHIRYLVVIENGEHHYFRGERVEHGATFKIVPVCQFKIYVLFRFVMYFTKKQPVSFRMAPSAWKRGRWRFFRPV
jgi:hypothetical protein